MSTDVDDARSDTDTTKTTRDEDAPASADQASDDDAVIGGDSEDTIPLHGWEGISSYADTEGFFADEMRAERFHVRQERRVRMPRRKARPEREAWEWRDLFATARDARANLVLATGAVVVLVGIIALIAALAARDSANDFRTTAESEIAALEQQLSNAQAALADAEADAGSVTDAVQWSHYTVTLGSVNGTPEVTRVGLWEIPVGSDDGEPTMRQAINAFGVPDKTGAIKGDAATCRATWTEAGVVGTFNLSSSVSSTATGSAPAACGLPDDAVATSLNITGEQWQLGEGVGIGGTVEDLQQAYSDAERSGSRYRLASEYSYTEGAEVPLLTVVTEDDKVTSMIVNFTS